jgi:hypothetical protein
VTPPLPGDVLTIRTSDVGGWLIRLGAWMRGRPHRDNHVVIVSHTDPAGVQWGIEGRPGGVGWVDMASYDGWSHSSNAEQPKTDDQRAAIVVAARGLLGIGYDWLAIGMDVAEALRIDLLWRPADWTTTVAPAHVVCSSLAAWANGHVGLARPGGGMATVTPGDWQLFNDRREWAR